MKRNTIKRKGSTGVSMNIWKDEEYKSDVFSSEEEYFEYVKVAGRIERELGIVYKGQTDHSLKRYVDLYSNRLKRGN